VANVRQQLFSMVGTPSDEKKRKKKIGKVKGFP
jgi:hypothetical protein